MLEAKNIHQYYGGSHILRDVSLRADTGQVTVLLGRRLTSRRMWEPP